MHIFFLQYSAFDLCPLDIRMKKEPKKVQNLK